MMTSRKGLRFFEALSLLLLATAAQAEADTDDNGRELVAGFVRDVATLAGNFEQRLTDVNGALLEESSGRLDIERPGKFRWDYSEPYEQWLVADGLNIWSYDLDLAQVTVKPQAEALASTPALLLGGADDALQDFVFSGRYDRDGLTWVQMRPVDADSGFRYMEMAFDGRQLSRMVFLDNLEQTTSVVLSDVVVNEPFDPDHFVFAVPKDADLVGTPAVVADVTTSASD